VKEKLVVYELLIRDFFANGDRSYDNLIDTISYLKRLGVNAIELMPVMEFNGNEGWGYNPTFMFAPDKYYGSKDRLKAFVDACHQEGIAVILDIAMNHHDVPNPYVMMDFDFTSFKPTAANKWFNVEAKHPFNVFFDMNHESSYTQAYLDTVNYYWLHEFKMDGFRFDLSKGFTQTNNPSNVNAWSAYDASRIALLKRMANSIWEHTPDAYIILEHFAANNEEKELVEYRVDEGKGMMVWGNLNHAYNQNTMGFAQDSDISWIYHGTRGWSVPHVVGYMESHDEERNMYKNITFGNSAGSYNVKNISTALNRVKAAEVIFYTIPGPKMLWEFGELGYDQSINRCEDGSISEDCRLSPKPVKWDYLNDNDRERLFQHTADLLRLRLPMIFSLMEMLSLPEELL
jgi:1,4-alpha-glucan branching enzyme